MITRHGIGNGVCLLLLVDLLVYVPGYLIGIGKEIVTRGYSAPVHVIGYLLAMIVVLVSVAWLVQARWQVPVKSDDGNAQPVRPLSLHVNSVGIAGYYLGISIFGLLTTAAWLWRGDWSGTVIGWSDTEGLVYWVIIAVVTFLATYWLAAMAYDPRGLRRARDHCGGTGDSSSSIDEGLFDRKLGITTTLLAVVVLAICIVLSWHASKHELTGLAGVSLFPMTAILIDTHRQYKLHRRLATDGAGASDGVACSNCGHSAGKEEARCGYCGIMFEGALAKCNEHGSADAHTTCIICGKALCDECAFEVRGRYTCEEHWTVELMQRWATAATVRTQVEAELCKRRLGTGGVSAEVFSNTVEPMYGTFGLFDVNPITPLLVYREIGGGRIRVLVPLSDWTKARRSLEQPLETK
jgi:hypothetical protein